MMGPSQQPQEPNDQVPLPPPQVYGLPGPGQNPAPANGSPSSAANKAGKRTLFIVAGAALLVVIVLVVVALLASGKKPKQAEQPPDTEAQSQLLEPAKAIDIEQISNAIGQDMSNLSNDKDFPADQLTDDTLNL